MYSDLLKDVWGEYGDEDIRKMLHFAAANMDERREILIQLELSE